jgi:hypothetical protein
MPRRRRAGAFAQVSSAGTACRIHAIFTYKERILLISRNHSRGHELMLHNLIETSTKRNTP